MKSVSSSSVGLAIEFYTLVVGGLQKEGSHVHSCSYILERSCNRDGEEGKRRPTSEGGKHVILFMEKHTHHSLLVSVYYTHPFLMIWQGQGGSGDKQEKVQRLPLTWLAFINIAGETW